MHSNRRVAFTLLEVMIVLAIIIIVGAVAYPSLEGVRTAFLVDNAVDDVKARLAECRSHAIEEGRAYRFAVQPNTSKYRIAPDGSDYWDGGTGGSGSNSTSGSVADDPNVQPLVFEDSIEDGILFRFADGSSLQSDSSGWTTVVVLLPDGTCQDDVEIKFEANGSSTRSIQVRAMTGVVKTSRGNSGDNE